MFGILPKKFQQRAGEVDAASESSESVALCTLQKFLQNLRDVSGKDEGIYSSTAGVALGFMGGGGLLDAASRNLLADCQSGSRPSLADQLRRHRPGKMMAAAYQPHA